VAVSVGVAVVGVTYLQRRGYSFSELVGWMAQGRAVLILEDEDLIASLLAEVVATAGYSVVGPAASAEKAQELINENGIDAALLDVTLEHGDQSLELAERLRAMRIPFAFITAYSRPMLPASLREMPCLEKPVSESDVVGVLAVLLPPSIRPA
jgi:CheY-like chemotaxis protein